MATTAVLVTRSWVQRRLRWPTSAPGSAIPIESHATIGQVRRVVPVTADLSRALGRQVVHAREQARERIRLQRYRLDHVLQLGGEPVLRDGGHLSVAQLVGEALDLGAGVLACGD